VLVTSLPPLLYSAAWLTSWRDFAAHRRATGLLAIGLVITTTAAIAAVAHAVIRDMPWAVACVLGAIVSPPDAAAATAVMQRMPSSPSADPSGLRDDSYIRPATCDFYWLATNGAARVEMPPLCM
jgi:CPA1 family monovalent cation:H+ antiporter